MIITADSQLRRDAIQLLRDEYNMTTHRPGLHQSELSYCLTKAYHDRLDPLPLTEKETLLFSVGFGLERVILAREESPDELVIDGISCSLDSIKLLGPIDLKSTRMRAGGRKGEDGFQIPEGWKRQFMAYRYALDKANYSKIPGLVSDPSFSDLSFGVIIIHLIEPELSAYRLEFTQQELDDNWARLLDRSNMLESMIAQQDPMPYQSNEEWECTHCKYSLRCGLSASIAKLEKGKMYDAQ